METLDELYGHLDAALPALPDADRSFARTSANAGQDGDAAEVYLDFALSSGTNLPELLIDAIERLVLPAIDWETQDAVLRLKMTRLRSRFAA